MRTLTLVLALWCLAIGAIRVKANNAGAVVLVNSHSAKYQDFAHFIQPYLGNFGVPYQVLDIASNTVDSSLTNYALIIIGHAQLDTNLTYLSSAAQSSISLAVSNGVGLVSFDNVLATSNTPIYQFEQDIFGLGYTNPVDGGNVVFPPTETGSTMHYITSLHETNELLVLSNSNSQSVMTVAGLKLPANDTAVATLEGAPFVVVTKHGAGRAVQWTSYDWILSMVQGPVNGLDDLVWRGFVWAARKPFVMRGLPNFVTVRVDDVTGNEATSGPQPTAFWWVHAMTNAGFKPFLALFTDDIVYESTAYPGDGRLNDLSNLVASGVVTASVHSFSATQTGPTNFFFFNHATGTNYSDAEMAQNFQRGTDFLTDNRIPSSTVVVAHFSEMGTNAFNGLTNWGVQFVMILVVPGQVAYTTPGAPWLMAGPYRLYETPQQAQTDLPAYYADWLTIPNHPELNGKFFDVCTELHDNGRGGDWAPGADNVDGAIARGTQMLKRSFDSLILATLYTHEFYIDQSDGPADFAAVTTNNFSTMLSAITNNLAPYHPIYVTMEYACQYVRATRTSVLANADADPRTGQITATFTGYTDLPITSYYYTGVDSGITNVAATVPMFSGGTNIVLAGPPQILLADVLGTNLEFVLQGPVGNTYSVEASTNLQGWASLNTVTLTNGTALLSVPVSSSAKFVRARLMQ